ncbi:MAG: hypothetical protein ACJ0S4_07485 [Candidatus Rariloculaceae bacterium]
MSVGSRIAQSMFACAAVVLVAACGQSADNTAIDDAAAVPAQQLPDWSGWWMEAEGIAGNGGEFRNADLYLPEARRLVEAGAAAYCVPTRFNGAGYGGQFSDVEFLLMSQRLTITNGDGLLRRIPIDGRPLRASPEPSNGGTSVGKWEGDILIIETIGLHPDTTFPAVSRPNGWLIGEDVHVLERLWLNEHDQLVVETELTAPQLLKTPHKFTIVYQRQPGFIYRDHDVCSLNDRAIDPETGRERFDMTPPDDLPPPPIN